MQVLNKSGTDNWRRDLWFLWGACVISSSSYTMLVPFLPVYLFDLGVSEDAIHMWSGLVFSVTFFVSAVMSPYWGRMADKAGKRQMLVRAGLSLAAVYFLGAFVRSPLELFIVRLLQGFATGFVSAALAIVASTAPEDKIGFGLGVIQAAMLTGTILGPLFGGGLAHFFGIRTSFIVAAAAMLLGTLAVRTLVTEPNRVPLPHNEGVVNDLRTAFDNKVLREMLVLTVITQVAVMIAQPLIPIYIGEMLGSLERVSLTAGIIIGAAGLAGAVAAPFWGRLGQKSGYARTLIFIFIGAGAFNILQLVVDDVIGFGLLQFVFGFFIAGALPMINTIITANTDAGFRGRAFGLMMSANQTGSMIGPLVGGAVSSWVGIKPVFACTGLFIVIVAAALWQRGRSAAKTLQ